VPVIFWILVSHCGLGLFFGFVLAVFFCINLFPFPVSKALLMVVSSENKGGSKIAPANHWVLAWDCGTGYYFEFF
jgi:hypothetical protein